MKKFLQDYQDGLLIFGAIVFLGIIVAFWVWGITEVAVVLNKVLNPPPPSSSSAKFDIEGARGLNL